MGDESNDDESPKPNDSDFKDPRVSAKEKESQRSSPENVYFVSQVIAVSCRCGGP